MNATESNPRFDLRGKVVVITGAGQGIGRAYARGFAESGAIPIIAEVNQEAGHAVAAELMASGHEALAIQTDISDVTSVQALVESTLERYQRVDVLVNNASIFSSIKMRQFTDIPLHEWNQVISVNITGTFLMCRAVAPYMKAQGGGRIVNISSAAVTMGKPKYLHYTTSKAGVIGMTRAMAKELGSSGITVNAVLPGATDTEIDRETNTAGDKAAMLSMRAIPRDETPEDLLGIVLFLASDESAFITGQSITVDGGLTFL